VEKAPHLVVARKKQGWGLNIPSTSMIPMTLTSSQKTPPLNFPLPSSSIKLGIKDSTHGLSRDTPDLFSLMVLEAGKSKSIALASVLPLVSVQNKGENSGNFALLYLGCFFSGKK
jgi:hypothetical protein